MHFNIRIFISETKDNINKYPTGPARILLFLQGYNSSTSPPVMKSLNLLVSPLFERLDLLTTACGCGPTCICCSGGYMDVQEGYMLFRGVIWCSGGLYAVQEGYMLKKIMMKIVATNVVASRPPNGDRLQRRPLVPISPGL